MMKRSFLISFLCLSISMSLLAVAFSTGPLLAEEDTPIAFQAKNEADVDAAKKKGQEAFEAIYQVAMHPRCINCHADSDTPMQGDESKPHTMHVQRGPLDEGYPAMECGSCHHKQAVEGPKMPPGVKGAQWMLAPSSMTFQGKSSRQLAAMFRSRRRSQLDGPGLIKHAREDHLLGWAWEPGEGRTAIPTPRADFVKAFETWVNAGMPLPERQSNGRKIAVKKPIKKASEMPNKKTAKGGAK